MKHSARLNKCPICGAKAETVRSIGSDEHVPTPDTYQELKCPNPDCPCRQCIIKCQLGHESWAWDRRSQTTWTRQEILNRVRTGYISKECPYLNLG